VLRVRTGGSGPPVVLLHGHPRTHTTWHLVAPLLAAAGHTVVCPDRRGYGRSSAPPTTADHGPYSKRAMAGDVVRLMGALGHASFAVVGHDRGSYVAMRTAMDHPTGSSSPSPTSRSGRSWPTPRPGAAPVPPARPRRWGRRTTPTTCRPFMTRTPSGPCSRTTGPAGGSTERPTRPTAPPAAGSPARPWSCGRARDDLEELFGDPLAVWADWTTDLRGGGPVDSGHHMAEDAPDELAAELR
jgi:haloacetate dehalogenase